jgi:hypothetical protein
MTLGWLGTGVETAAREYRIVEYLQAELIATEGEKDSYIPDTTASAAPSHACISTHCYSNRALEDTVTYSRQHTAQKAHQHPSHDTPGRDALSDQDGAEDDQEPDEEGEEEGAEEVRGEH